MQRGRGGVTVQRWGSFRVFISPPPPLLPFSFLGFEIPEVAAQLEGNCCASSWYSRLQSRSTKVGSLEFGDCCGERWRFSFSFHGLDPFAPRRLLPHLKRMKSCRRCSFPERGPRLPVTAAPNHLESVASSRFEAEGATVLTMGCYLLCSRRLPGRLRPLESGG